MLEKVLTPFFIGQVAIEKVTEISKSEFDAACTKAKAKADQLKTDVEEYKSVQVVGKIEEKLKTGVAKLRNTSEPFEKACESVAKLLAETSEMKDALPVAVEAVEAENSSEK